MKAPLLFLLTVFFFGCDSHIYDSIQKASTDNPPNIIFVVSDALRADHLGVYGYQRNISPFLDSLAKKGVIFMDVKSPSSWTIPSMVSIFSGISPLCFDANVQAVPDSLDFITDICKRRGYHTYGVSANPLLQRHINFPKGLDHFKFLTSRDGEDINGYLFENLRPKMKEPYFLWLHYMDTHGGFQPPPELARKINPNIKKLYMPQENHEVTKRTPEEMQNALDLYDAEILYWDSLVKDLFQSFNHDPNILWVIFSDHGDEFGDHGGEGHGQSLYEELLHIPLILYSERMFPRPIVVKKPISGIDILPTVAELAGFKAHEQWEGKNVLTRAYLEQEFITHATIFPRDYTKVRDLKAVYKNNWKYIHDYTRNEHLLFNLSEDPGEKMNQLHDFKTKAQELSLRLRQYVESKKSKYAWDKAMTPDPKTAESIKALGY